MEICYIYLMKHFLISLVALSAQCLASQEIQNADFESAVPLENWRPDGEGFAAVLSADGINGGKHVLKVENIGGEFFSMSQTAQRDEREHLEKWKITGWIKTDGVTNGLARLWFRASDKQGRRLTFVDFKPTITKGTTEWHQVEMTVAVPAPATKFEYGVVLTGPGTAWFDALSLQKLENKPSVRSPKATKFLDDAFAIIRKNSIRRDSVDMPSLRQLMYVVAEEAQTTQQCHEAIGCVLANLGDHHSFLQEKEEYVAYGAENPTIMMPSGKMMGSIAYLKVPGFLSVNKKMGDQYAGILKKLITDYDAKATGWVIDVRHNTGGNCAPMLLGVGPLLGNGFASGGKDAYGTKDVIIYKNGGLYDKKKRYQKIDHPYSLLKGNPKVAILTDGMCASSGEVVVMAFKNAPNSKSFGAPTFGNTTGNTDFRLPDGSCIFLATHLGMDRAGNVYDSKILPDVAVEDEALSDTDEVLESAMQWLKAD
jgi:carboxyl-terminal processing protease